MIQGGESNHWTFLNEVQLKRLNIGVFILITVFYKKYVLCRNEMEFINSNTNLDINKDVLLTIVQ